MSVDEVRDYAWGQFWRANNSLEELVEGIAYNARAGEGITQNRDALDTDLAAAFRLTRAIRAHINDRALAALLPDLEKLFTLVESLRGTSPLVAWYRDQLADWTNMLQVPDVELLYRAPSTLTTSFQLLTTVSDELLALLARQPHLMHDLSPRRFEELIAELFRRGGFDVELTQQTRDGGADIVAISTRMQIKQKLIVECKKYAPENRVGVAVVQRILGVKSQSNANKAVVVTTSSFTRDAWKVARDRVWDLDLKAYLDIATWLRGAP